MKHSQVLMAAAAVLAVSASTGVAASQMRSSATSAPAAVDSAPSSPTELLAGCPGGRTVGGEIDSIPPEGRDRVVKDNWPTSPVEAATRALASPLLFPANIGQLTIGQGRTVSLPTGDETESTPAVEFAITDLRGDAVGLITVQKLTFGAYAVTSSERCA